MSDKVAHSGRGLVTRTHGSLISLSQVIIRGSEARSRGARFGLNGEWGMSCLNSCISISQSKVSLRLAVSKGLECTLGNYNYVT